jgi:hypothetical protein
MLGITRRQFLATTLAAASMSVRAEARAATASIEGDFQGCFLRGQPETRVLDRFRLFASSNDKEVDQVCKTAEADLRRLFRVSRCNALNRRWQHRLTGFVAHEWAHIVQFARNYLAPGKAAELHADFLAGWFLGRTAGSSGVRDEAMYRLYFLGDDAVNHPDHHGTPMERASATTNGFDLAAKVDNIDAAFSARRF